MRLTTLFLIAAALLVPVAIAHSQGQKSMDIYYIDTEGGKAQLIVSPSGESLLFDVGTGDARHFQADNVMRAVKEAGVQQLDYVIVSHYHGDHVGNAAELSSRLPIRQWYDHGGYTTENQPGRNTGFLSWLPTREHSKVTVPKPGDKIPIAGLDVMFVAGSGKVLATPVPGARAPARRIRSAKTLRSRFRIRPRKTPSRSASSSSTTISESSTLAI